MAPVAVVVGAGPGTGFAVAQRFAEGGFHVALMARNKATLDSLVQTIASSGGQSTAIACDSTQEASVEAAFKEAKALGSVEVLVYNAAGGFQFPPPKFAEIPLALLQGSLNVNVVGGFLTAQQVVPDMVTRGKGTIIFTGATASVKGSPGFAAFAAGKFGLRALAQSLARELGPQGVHVAHVIVDGIIGTPRVKKMMPNKSEETLMSPSAIAQAYWDLHSQHKSAWSQEVDLRPYLEKF